MNGKYILFGTYPKSEVGDASLITSLNSLAGALPSESNAQAWTSYGYYKGSGTMASKQNYMWYIDVEYGDENYRGVYFTSCGVCPALWIEL